MQFFIAQDAAMLAQKATDFLIGQWEPSSPWSLGCATGSTPIPTYVHFIRQVLEKNSDLSKFHCFHLDEYAGMSQKDRRSFASYIQKYIVEPLKLKPAQVALWQGNAPDADAVCADYEKKIQEAGGIDCQILGLGINGHIGFNEPGSEKNSRCRKIALTEETLIHNAQDLEGGLQPTHGLTMGIANILEARSILLLVSGKNKTESLKQFLTLNPTPSYPASFLRGHPNLTVIADRAAFDPLKESFQGVVTNEF